MGSSRPTLNAADISALSSAIKDAYQPLLKQEIEQAVREIPFRIREQLEQILADEIRAVIRKAVAKSVYVEVKAVTDVV